MAAVASPFVWAVLRNNAAMDGWRKEFFSIPPPAGTSVVSRGSDFGLHGPPFDHAGNSCDRLAWVEIRGSTDTGAIETYYEVQLHQDTGLVLVRVVDSGLVRVERFDQYPAGLDYRCT